MRSIKIGFPQDTENGKNIRCEKIGFIEMWKSFSVN